MVTVEVVVVSTPPSGRTRTHVARIDFHIDTGSDVTVIGRIPFMRDLGLSPDDASAGISTVGIGARLASRVMPGYLFFGHEDGSRTGESIDFVIPLTADDAQAELCVLGLDIVLRGRLTLDHESVLIDLPAPAAP